MSRNNVDGVGIRASTLEQTINTGVNRLTSGATINLNADAPMANFVILTGSGQNLVLPDPTLAGMKGRTFYIFNLSASALSITVKQFDGTTTVITIAQNKAGILVNNGLLWYGLLGS
jgi:calcineurin-like phosphoesterase